ncbi:T9SS type A sorting domain-containing protein [Psychroserpens ponticola]|uniref:T9SS type A sorting domain-containing protein n=1 Tax=Psychroserpens ponticola TaxID=2932268 RepID=A0ABY7S3J0_9FLAO|nr:T9SS type A sorting domain-containing protein [Psychroserpens ponticola]WCO03575.1 T9SS type A sorting domain-containing protein [Psychroserpens ponticola]
MKTKLRSFLLNLVIVIMPVLGFSQCPGTITLTSQAEVDAFPTNYPSCTDIDGTLTISGNDITDLTPLLGIETVYHLYIQDNPLLVDLTGLNNFTGEGVDEFIISNNDNLININGLSSYVSNYGIRLHYNNSLQNLIGISPSFAGTIQLLGNPNIQSLEGLEVISSLFGILLQSNNSLSDISALSNVSLGNDTYVDIIITDNPNLSNCNIESVCYSLANCISECSYQIENNAEGCSNILEIGYNCGIEPRNDDCSSSFLLTLGEQIVAYNELATSSNQIPSCNNVSNRADVWFSFNTGANEFIDINVSEGYNLQLWSGTCSSLTQVNNACSTGSLVNIPVSTFTYYKLQVWSEDTGRMATGLFDIVIQDELLSTQDISLIEFSLYPNPTSNILNLKSNKTITQVKVHNLLGQEIMSLKPNSFREEIDLVELNSGMYLVTVENNNSSAVYRVIKE